MYGVLPAEPLLYASLNIISFMNVPKRQLLPYLQPHQLLLSDGNKQYRALGRSVDLSL